MVRVGQVCRQRVSIGGFGARPHHTKSSEASRGAQADRRMAENRVRSVGESMKKSEVVCKTTANGVIKQRCESLHLMQLALVSYR
jgi:hypothetical protein